MTTSDSNGLPQFQGSDPADIGALLNLLSAAASNAFNAQVRPFLVANITERDTLATSRPPTTQNPLLVWLKSSGKFQMNSGSGWADWPPTPPSKNFPKAGTTTYSGGVPGGQARDITVNYGSAIVVGNYVPLITVRGTRGDVDRLYATISRYGTESMNVVIKNTTGKAVTKNVYIDWSLIPK